MRYHLFAYLWHALLALLCATASSFAAPRHGTLGLAAYEGGSVADQLQTDITPVPPGMGAILVPSLTDPRLEPAVLVYLGSDRVAWGRTGERIVLPPGEYRVVVGHGPVEQRATVRVRVVAGATVPTPPFFAALRVTATDRDGVPIEVDYQLESVEDRTRVGEGETSAGTGYAATPTWLLAGRPVTLALSGGSDEDRSAVSLMLAPGQIARYRLVMDHDRILRAEFATREETAKPSPWRLYWVIGGDASFSRAEGQLGSFNGDYLRAGLFTHANIGWEKAMHLVQFRLELDESWVGLTDRPGQSLTTQKFSDEAEAELLYSYRLRRIVGPYVRGMARTSFFETHYTPAEGTRVIEEDSEGRRVGESAVAAGDDVVLFDPLQPLVLRSGAGLTVAPVDTEVFSLGLRAGPGLRRAWYGGGRYIQRYSPREIVVQRIGDDDSWGLEAAAWAKLHLGRTVGVDLRADLYVPRAQLAKDEDLQPILRLDGDLTFYVNPFLSVVYEASWHRDAYEIEDLAFSSNLSVRIQHALF